MYDVIRNFGLDYIYFDILFLIVFVFLLIRSKAKIPLMALFAGGLGINFLIDWGIWYHSGLRTIVLPENFLGGAFLFFLWFSISYGVEYAYVFLMFRRKNIWRWTGIVFAGWLLVALLSQLVLLNDSFINTTRHMSDLRWLRIVIVVLGYGLVYLLKRDWKLVLYLFFIGFLVHFMMEFSLLIAGIRPGSFLILLENSLIEFNMGVPFFYLLWNKLLKKYEKR